MRDTITHDAIEDTNPNDRQHGEDGVPEQDVDVVVHTRHRTGQ